MAVENGHFSRCGHGALLARHAACDLLRSELRVDRYDVVILLSAFLLDIFRPFLHEPHALVEMRAAQIRGFGAVAVDVGKRRLCDLSRVVRPFRCPRPETATHSVRYAFGCHALHRLKHRQVRQDAARLWGREDKIVLRKARLRLEQLHGLS